MNTAADIIARHGLQVPSTAPGRYYSICPECSSSRQKEHQKIKCVGVTINDRGGGHFGCNHCGWKGPTKKNGHAGGEWDIVATYDYLDEAGELLFQKVRTASKKFWQRKPDGHGGWISRVAAVRKVVYRLPELRASIASGRTIVCVEGEKDANNLWALDIPATCNPGGAASPGQRPKWRKEFSEMLRGADIVVIGDNDPSGRTHADVTAKMSLGIAKRVRILDLAKHWPECPKGGDVSDWLAAGHTREELELLIADAAKALDEAPPIIADNPGSERSNIGNGGLEDRVALDFANTHASTFCFIAKWGRWVKWDGDRWRPEDTLRAFDEARKLCREAGDAKARTVAAVVNLARTDRRLAATDDQWDRDPKLFNTPGRTINLNTGVASAPDRLHYITKVAAIAPAPQGTPHPIWTAFLERVTNSNPELIGFLQRYLGYCLTGHTFEHVLVFLYGLGANGKSVFINTVSRIFGDYAAVAPMELFMASKHDRHPTEVAKLQGARLVTAQETEKGRRWDVAKIKSLTADDKLTARFMRQDFFDFAPTHKLIITGNHKPMLPAVDEAIRRRFLLIPFVVEIPKAERDPDLAQKLQGEWPAILRWMVEGCLEWQRNGLMVPAIVRDATAEYLADQDATAQWIDEWIERDLRAFALTGDLFKSWKSWCEQRNNYIGTETAFSDELADRGFERDRKKYGRGFKGIWLRSSNEQQRTDSEG
jgi:putative DNA primase/helicase